jgi:N-acetylglucosaminylphosphatidylinositol deacetylase
MDGLKEKWCEETILNEVNQYVSENSIKAIFTFDKRGVSDHPNHKAIYEALSACEEVEVKAV